MAAIGGGIAQPGRSGSLLVGGAASPDVGDKETEVSAAPATVPCTSVDCPSAVPTLLSILGAGVTYREDWRAIMLFIMGPRAFLTADTGERGVESTSAVPVRTGFDAPRRGITFGRVLVEVQCAWASAGTVGGIT